MIWYLWNIPEDDSITNAMVSRAVVWHTHHQEPVPVLPVLVRLQVPNDDIHRQVDDATPHKPEHKSSNIILIDLISDNLASLITKE